MSPISYHKLVATPNYYVTRIAELPSYSVVPYFARGHLARAIHKEELVKMVNVQSYSQRGEVV